MLELKPNYLMNDSNKRVAVQLSIKQYQKIEEVLENYGLYHLMTDAGDADNEPLAIGDARTFYNALNKK